MGQLFSSARRRLSTILAITVIAITFAGSAGFIRCDTAAGQEQGFSLRTVQVWEADGEYQKAFDALSTQIAKTPDQADLYYWRGRSAFCLGKIEESVADFDRLVELTPRVKSRQWERGIALYYDKSFEAGAAQFELYQSYHDNDVENSVWRYLCVARDAGTDEARKTILPIRDDRRVPMMNIFRMFKGEETPEDVMQAAEVDPGSAAALNRQRFYANLYVGLFLEAQGKAEEGLVYIRRAQDLKIDHYMWNVADIHVKLADQ